MNSTYLKTLRIVYFALAMGIILFFLVAIFLNSSTGAFMGNELTSDEKTPFLIVLVVLTGIIFFAYRSIIPRKLTIIQSLPPLDNKRAAWRELNFLQGALFEAPSFLAIVLFLLLGLHVLLIWPIVGIALFWFTQPSREKLISEANLSSNEISEFDTME
jgi:uncharacterized integral membrane protein